MAEKTNVMRQLEAAGIAYTAYYYDASDGNIDGLAVAQKIGKPTESVFKTLLAIAPDGEICVFIIPVDGELDLKKAAQAAKVKNIVLAPVKDILKISGYIKGGCSPVGMKRLYRSFVAEDAILLETMICSAGKIGAQIELAPDDLLQQIAGSYADLLK
jgi:Cys-tRNA(Pro)/Cys-tRNA(Cys) deacylase